MQDDESGLIYMRARYYEPGTGRFISEDPGMSGQNYFQYGNSNPIAYCDGTGQSADEIEDAVRRLIGKGDLDKDFWRIFRDRTTGVRDAVHEWLRGEKVTGQSQLPDDEVLEACETAQERYSTGIEMETDSEVTSDLAAGQDMGSLLLEEQVLIAEETAPVVEGGL